MVFAQLYTSDGRCHGLHAFVVPIRCPHSLRALPGVIVGDMGEKLGQNGLDNGWVVFDHYRIPRENLLNRGGDVTPEGEYVSPHKVREVSVHNGKTYSVGFFQEGKKRLANSLGALSSGRVGITGMAAQMLRLALPIVVRYSALRRQFSPAQDIDGYSTTGLVSNGGTNADTEEWPVLEYPLQQWRVIPYLAATYALTYFSKTFHSRFVDYTITLMAGEKTPELVRKH